MADAPAGCVGIAAVERDTGIGKETLRVWERRYGFPAPGRDASGERLYSPEQVQRLRLVKRLLDAGHRPGRVVAASLQELLALVAPAPFAPGLDTEAPEVAACMALLQAHGGEGLQQALSRAVLRRGLPGAVCAVFAPLAMRIGDRVVSGELQPFQERLFGESLQLVLRQAVGALTPEAGGPRVLLSTLPGDDHASGLAMLHALLCLEGAACLPLGVQLPPAQLPLAAIAHEADIVALTFSGRLSGKAVLEGLAGLRELLPRHVEIWAAARGGVLRPPPGLQGLRPLNDLSDVGPELARWRELLESRL
jgi:hypothetical protein